jgi:hypothetical protein
MQERENKSKGRLSIAIPHNQEIIASKSRIIPIMAYHGADDVDYSEDTTLGSHCKKAWLSYDCLHDAESIMRNPECWLCSERDGLCEPMLMEDVVDENGECVECVMLRSEIATRAEDAEREREGGDGWIERRRRRGSKGSRC